MNRPVSRRTGRSLRWSCHCHYVCSRSSAQIEALIAEAYGRWPHAVNARRGEVYVWMLRHARRAGAAAANSVTPDVPTSGPIARPVTPLRKG